MLRVLFVIISIFMIQACAPRNEYSRSPSKRAGYNCGLSGGSIDQCAKVCDKMRNFQTRCWTGYFDGRKEVETNSQRCPIETGRLGK